MRPKLKRQDSGIAPHTWDLRQPEFRMRLALLDMVLNFALFTPLIILHYHSVTGIVHWMFISWLPTYVGPFVLFTFAVSSQFLIAFFQNRVPDFIPKDASRQNTIQMVANRLYTMMLVFCNVSHVYAVQCIFDVITVGTWGGAVKAAVTSFVLLCALRASRNVLCPPLSISLDTQDTHYSFNIFPTYLRSKADESTESALDVGITIGVVYSLLHLHWAGVDGMLGWILFPGQPLLTCISALLVGYGACTLIFVFQHSLRKMALQFEKESETKQIVFEDLFMFASSVSIVTTWRGIWMTFDFLSGYFPMYIGSFDITAFACWIISYGLLWIANITDSLPYKGCDKDGELKQGEGVMCSTKYFFHYMENQGTEESQSGEIKRKNSDPNITPTNNNTQSVATDKAKQGGGARQRLSGNIREEDVNPEISNGTRLATSSEKAPDVSQTTSDPAQGQGQDTLKKRKKVSIANTTGQRPLIVNEDKDNPSWASRNIYKN